MSPFGIPLSGAATIPVQTTRRGGSHWPIGEYVVPHEDLAGILGQSAQDAARRAIQLFTSDERLDLLQAAVNTGTAIEHLVKAAVVLIEPTLIAERADRDTLLHLSGKGHHAECAATGIRTLGALPALKQLASLHRSVTIPIPLAEAALEARNAAVHVGLVDRDALRAAVKGMCSIIDAILTAVEADRARFWNSNLSVVDALIEEGRAEIDSMIEAKYASARARLDELTRGVPPEVVAPFLATLARKHTSTDHEEETPCPVCSQTAWLLCWVEEGAIEVDHDAGWWTAYVPRTAYPFEFECSVCGLRLEEFELVRLDLELPIELEPRDVEEDDIQEPDEDLYRGR